MSIINFIESEGCIVRMESGHYAFWPDKNIGAYTAHDLRVIAAYLDAKNTDAEHTLLGMNDERR